MSKNTGLVIAALCTFCLLSTVVLFLGYYWGRNDQKAEVNDAFETIATEMRERIEDGKRPQVKETREEALAITIRQIENIQSALKLYREDCGSYPTEKSGLTMLIVPPSDGELNEKWKGPYLFGSKLPKDSWGNEFNYRLNTGSETEKDYVPLVTSSGPDGLAGTSDDI